MNLNLSKRQQAEFSYLLKSSIVFSEMILEEPSEEIMESDSYQILQQTDKIRQSITKDNVSIYSIQLVYNYLTAVADMYKIYSRRAKNTDDEGIKFIAERVKEEFQPLEDYIEILNELMNQEEES